MATTLGGRIRERREELQLSQLQLAELSGVSQQAIDQIEKDRVAKPRHLLEIAAALGLRAEWLRDGSGRRESVVGRALSAGAQAAAAVFQPQRNAGQPLLDVTLGKPDLDVYGSAQGGPYGMIVDPHPVERIARPRLLMGVHDAFGVYVVGDSMEPVFDQGDMAYVHPARPPRRGDDVLIYRDNDGHWEAMIKRLEGWNEKTWRLKQFCPEKSFALSRQDWPHIMVVTGRERGG